MQDAHWRCELVLVVPPNDPAARPGDGCRGPLRIVRLEDLRKASRLPHTARALVDVVHQSPEWLPRTEDVLPIEA